VWGEKMVNSFRSKMNKAVLLYDVRAFFDNGKIALSADVDRGTLGVWTDTPRLVALMSNKQQLEACSMMSVTTPSWTTKPIEVDGPALPTCSGLLETVKQMSADNDDDILWQANNVVLTIMMTDDLFTKDGSKMYLTAVLRDWSGSCKINIVGDAAMHMFDCGTVQEVRQQQSEGTLKPLNMALNVRGVRRTHDDTHKNYIAQILPWNIEEKPSGTVKMLRDFLPDDPPLTSDGFITAPLSNLDCDVLTGLVVNRGTGGTIGAHRVCAFICGTQKSKLMRVAGNDECRIVVSENVKCLLCPDAMPDQPLAVSLRAYANEMELLDYKLDQEAAIVHISDVSKDSDGTTGTIMCTVDFMVKVPPSQIPNVKEAFLHQSRLTLEPLTTPKRISADYLSPGSIKKARLLKWGVSDAPN